MNKKEWNRELEGRSLGRSLPSYIEAEEAIVGSVISRSRILDEIQDLHPRMFYRDEYGGLFGIVQGMHKENKPIDPMTVFQEAVSQGKSGEYPLHAITAISNAGIHVVPATAARYALIIKQKFIQRETIRIGHEMIQKAYDDLDDIGDVLHDCGVCIESLQDDLIGQDDIKSFSEVSELAIKDINRRIALYAAGKQTGITTGLADLDRITSGWQGSELIIIAARPAMGKTAIALHFAKSAAISGTPVALFSLEMDFISLHDRILLSEANVSPESLKCGNLSGDDVSKIDKATGAIHKLPIFIDDNASVSMGYIRSKCRLLHKKGKCGLVIIDYLQLASESGSKDRNREQEVTKMSREAKLIAKELNVPVLLLSQLNRNVESRPDKKPMLSDLRESGSIEQDADMVMFIHRPEYYGIIPTNKNTGEEERNCGKLIIAKYRNGKVGEIKFKHNDSLTKIYDYDTRGYSDYIPLENNNPF